MKPKPRKTFAATLKAKRESARLTQQEAARKLDVPEKTYVNWEQGRNTPDSFKRQAILEKL
jgi:DNA-binding XRE family transcriptional regulator